MNLVIDIGNTRTKIAIFEKAEMVFENTLEEFSENEIQEIMQKFPQIDAAIISATKSYPESVKTFLEKTLKTFIDLDHHTYLPIENLYESKQTQGKDRLAAAIGANFLFPNQNILIIDAGTAITFELVSKENKYLGGNISPGLSMRFKALNQFTGKLPLIEFDDEFELMGRNTTEAIRAGVQNGILFETKQYIDYLSDKYENLKVILTGGDAKFFDKKLKNSIFVHFYLTLLGLNRILDFNRS